MHGSLCELCVLCVENSEIVSGFQGFVFFCLIPWDLAFGIWNFVKVAALFKHR